MKHWCIATLVLGGALALPIVGQDKGQDGKPPVEAPKVELLKLGSTVPETVAMKDLDGKTQTFKDLRGKVVVIHFWSDRCPAEKHADPVFKKLEKHFEGKNVVMLGIASNQGELGTEPAKDADYSKAYPNLRKKLKEVELTHKIVADHGNKLSSLFQAKTTPHCYVIDTKGVISYVGALDDDLQESKGEAAKVYVRDAAEALLAGKPVETKETRPYG